MSAIAGWTRKEMDASRTATKTRFQFIPSLEQYRFYITKLFRAPRTRFWRANGRILESKSSDEKHRAHGFIFASLAGDRDVPDFAARDGPGCHGPRSAMPGHSQRGAQG